MRQKKQMLAVLLMLLFFLHISMPAFAAVTENQLKTAVEGSAASMLQTIKAPQFGSIGGEWAIIGLVRSGAAVPQYYRDTYYANVESYVRAQNGVLHTRKYTEYSRAILALTVIGKNPANVAGYNLLTPLGDFDKTIAQGINGPVWALLALDCGQYAMPVNQAAKTQATRQLYVDEILSRQLDCGGWNLTAKGGSGAADADVTGMVLQALAAYQQQPAVKNAIAQALNCLSDLQQADGGFGSSAESTAQVQVALSALGIGQNDVRFVKNGHTVLDGLLQYRQADGSFIHTTDGTGSEQMASEQGLYAMAAALRAMQGKTGLYDMSDVTNQTTAAENKTEHSAALSRPVTLTEQQQRMLDYALAQLICNGSGYPWIR